MIQCVYIVKTTLCSLVLTHTQSRKIFSDQSMPQICPLRSYSTRNNGEMTVESGATGLLKSDSFVFRSSSEMSAECCERRCIEKITKRKSSSPSLKEPILSIDQILLYETPHTIASITPFLWEDEYKRSDHRVYRLPFKNFKARILLLLVLVVFGSSIPSTRNSLNLLAPKYRKQG